jgi:hypothetical protein
MRRAPRSVQVELLTSELAGARSLYAELLHTRSGPHQASQLDGGVIA